MGHIDYSRLKFRRNYLITRSEKELSFMHNTVKLPDNYKLKVHPDLVYTELEEQGRKLILLGDIYDSSRPEKSNSDILHDLISAGFTDLLERSAMYAGRYVIIHIENNSFRLFHDASAMRKIYIARHQGELVISSRPFIIADLLGLEPTQDSSKLSFYNSEHFRKFLAADFANTTYFDEVTQLLPNFYLDVQKDEIKRFWPQKALETLPREEIIRESAAMIQGFVKAVAHRYPLMMGVTAGYDSRLIMAATRDIDQDILYYLNIPEELEESLDLKIHKKIFTGEKIPSTIFRFSEKAPEEFRKVFFENNPLAHPGYVDINYNYLLNFPERINLPGGVITVAKSVYRPTSEMPDAQLLADNHYFGQYKFAVDFCEEYLSEAIEVSKKTNFNIFELSWHENIHSTMGIAIQLDKDIAQEEFIIFNSAYLIQRMLTYEFKLRKKPRYKLHTDLIRLMWPELMKYPFNPSMKNKIKDTLLRLNLYEPALKLKKRLKY